MNKILVSVFFPKIDKHYDVWIPINKKVYTIISLLAKGVNELNFGIYQETRIPILYNKLTGQYYDLNSYICNTNIKNGTELILI